MYIKRFSCLVVKISAVLPTVGVYLVIGFFRHIPPQLYEDEPSHTHAPASTLFDFLLLQFC
jgi:hypothetical protein